MCFFKAYDDDGIFAIGTKRKCLNSVVKWAEEEESGNVYSENELVEIINFFSRKHENLNEIEFSGFKIAPLEPSDNIEKVL